MTTLTMLATLAALQAYTTTTDAVYCRGRTSAGDGFEGVFEWVAGNQSANVSADTQHGVWVPPSSDTTGASGAWKRVFDGPTLFARWFGAKPDGTTDCTAAINGALTVAKQLAVFSDFGSGMVVELDQGRYLHAGLIVKQNVTLRGQGSKVTALLLKSAANTHSISCPEDTYAGSDSIAWDTSYTTIESLSVFGNGSAQTATSWDIFAADSAYNPAQKYIRGLVLRDVLCQFGRDGNIFIGFNRNWSILDFVVCRYSVNGGALSLAQNYDARISKSDFCGGKWCVKSLAEGLSFDQCNFYVANDSASAYTVDLLQYCGNHSFTDCWIGECTQGALRIDGTQSTPYVTIKGNGLYSVSRAGTGLYPYIYATGAAVILLSDLDLTQDANIKASYLAELYNTARVTVTGVDIANLSSRCNALSNAPAQVSYLGGGDGNVQLPTVSTDPTVTPITLGGRVPAVFNQVTRRLWTFVSGGWKDLFLSLPVYRNSGTVAAGGALSFSIPIRTTGSFESHPFIDVELVCHPFVNSWNGTTYGRYRVIVSRDSTTNYAVPNLGETIAVTGTAYGFDPALYDVSSHPYGVTFSRPDATHLNVTVTGGASVGAGGASNLVHVSARRINAPVAYPNTITDQAI